MKHIDIKNKLLNTISERMDDFQGSLGSISGLLEEWKEVVHFARNVDDYDNEDKQLLLSFINYQDDALSQLRKMYGQTLYILMSEPMQKAIRSGNRPKVIISDFPKN